GATNQRYVVSASGSYTVKVTVNGCPSAASPAVPVTVSPLPAAPAATADGATTFCQGGTVTLSSSRATGNEWFESGNRIDGATNQRYVVSASGSYTVKVTEGNGFTSAASNAVAVTVNPNPNATITAPPTVTANATGFPASVANAGEGANYEWMITNGTITAGTDPTNITFTSGTVGTLTLRCTVTTSAGCQDSRPANVNVVPQPLMPMFDAAIACRAGGFDSDMCAKFLLGAYPGTTALQMATVLSLAWAGIMNNRLLEDSLLEGEYSPNDVASAVKETLHLDWRTNATYPNSRLPNVSKVHALYQGDLANLSAGEMVDFLVVSALPGDYTPTPGSLIGALAARGVSVQQLSENPAANYPQFHCWVSSPIAGQNFNQLIVFESTGAEAPANIPGILSTLQAYWPNPHAGSNYPFATIAQPLVSTGRAGANPDAVLTALFQSAASVLPGNYGLGCVMTVVYDRSQADAMTQLFNSLAGK
ncbi:MAG TPA: hypothetical protein VEK11_03970, partial [Thermoanaerobaculia bacterium]|nr:hypothetical protein [Thermoanaerobaculia bacterium]